MNPTALVIDDELSIRRLLRVALEAVGYTVQEAENGQQSLNDVAMGCPDVVLLDLGLPDLDGLQVLRRLREWSDVPVLILSVRDDESDKVDALDAGADDYVTKPFLIGELTARLRAAQRRARPVEGSHLFTAHDLTVDLATRSVTPGGEDLRLTATEYALLRLFVRHAGRIFTHRHILHEIWGPKSAEHRQYLRVYVTHLRQKIEADPSRPVMITTEHGVGYRFTQNDGI